MHINENKVIFSNEEKTIIKRRYGTIKQSQVYGKYFIIDGKYILTVKQFEKYLKDNSDRLINYRITCSRIIEIKNAELANLYIEEYLNEKKYWYLLEFCKEGLYSKDKLLDNFEKDIDTIEVEELYNFCSHATDSYKKKILTILKTLPEKKKLDLAINDPIYFREFLTIDQYAFLLSPEQNVQTLNHVRSHVEQLSDEMLIYLVRIFKERIPKFFLKELKRRRILEKDPFIKSFVDKFKQYS